MDGQTDRISTVHVARKAAEEMNMTSDTTYMAFRSRQLCISSGCQQSIPQRHLGSNAHCFSEMP